MKILIDFHADNAAFVDDFEGEVKKIMKQATDYLIGDRDSNTLIDTNGNKVGAVSCQQ